MNEHQKFISTPSKGRAAMRKHLLKFVAKGDQVEATYTEAVAIEVTPAAKK
jgi:hypothetical protein